MQKNKQQKKPNNQQNNQPSSVLLIVINNKTNKILTHDIFFKLFSQHGEVQKILIFERSILWKAFIQMNNLESALNAKQQLNNYQIDKDTKLCIYYSNLQTIELQENNSGGVDYTMLKKKIEEKKIKTNVGSDNLQKPTCQVTTADDTIHHVILDREFEQMSQSQQSKLSSQMENSQQQISKSQNMSIQKSSQLPPNKDNATLDTSQNLGLMSKSVSDQTQKMMMSQGLFNRNQHPNQPQQFPINQKQSSNDQLQLTKMHNSDNTISEKFKENENQAIYLSAKKASNQKNTTFNQQGVISNFNQQLSKFSNINNNKKQFKEDKINNAIDDLVDFKQEYSFEEIQKPDQDNQIIQPSTIQENVITKKKENTIDNNRLKDLDNYVDVVQETTSDSDDNIDLNKDKIQQFDKEKQKQIIINTLDNHFQQELNQKTNHSVNNIDLLINNKCKSTDYDKQKQQNKIYQSVDFSQRPYQQPNYNSIDFAFLQRYTGPTFLSMDLSQQQTNYALQQNDDPKNDDLIRQNDMAQQYQDITEHSDLASYINPLFLKATRKSKVIYARWFEREKVNMTMLYNIFSTFGNIVKMIFIKEKCSVLIEYQQVESAQLVKDYLNDIMYMGQMIRIFYSNYEEIFIKNFNKDKPPSDTQEEYFIGSEATNRFKGEKSIQIYPPSDTLHVSNLKREACSVDILSNLFEQCGKIKRIKFILQDNNKNMCLIQFDSKETALLILSNYHNVEVCGKKIKISFSKLKL